MHPYDHEMKVEKRLLIKRLEQVEDQGLLRAIKSMLDYGLGPAEGDSSLEAYNRELDLAMKEFEEGKGIPHERVLEDVKSFPAIP